MKKDWLKNFVLGSFSLRETAAAMLNNKRGLMRNQKTSFVIGRLNDFFSLFYYSAHTFALVGFGFFVVAFVCSFLGLSIHHFFFSQFRLDQIIHQSTFIGFLFLIFGFVLGLISGIFELIFGSMALLQWRLPPVWLGVPIGLLFGSSIPWGVYYLFKPQWAKSSDTWIFGISVLVPFLSGFLAGKVLYVIRTLPFPPKNIVVTGFDIGDLEKASVSNIAAKNSDTTKSYRYRPSFKHLFVSTLILLATFSYSTYKALVNRGSIILKDITIVYPYGNLLLSLIAFVCLYTILKSLIPAFRIYFSKRQFWIQISEHEVHFPKYSGLKIDMAPLKYSDINKIYFRNILFFSTIHISAKSGTFFLISFFLEKRMYTHWVYQSILKRWEAVRQFDVE